MGRLFLQFARHKRGPLWASLILTGLGCAQKAQQPAMSPVPKEASYATVTLNELSIRKDTDGWTPFFKGSKASPALQVAPVVRTFTPAFSTHGQIGRGIYLTKPWSLLTKNASLQVLEAIATRVESKASSSSSFSPDLALALDNSAKTEKIYILIDTSHRSVGTLASTSVLEDPKPILILGPTGIDQIVRSSKDVSHEALRAQGLSLRIYLCGCDECRRVIQALRPQSTWNASVIFKGSEGDASLYKREMRIECPVIADGDGRMTESAGVKSCPSIDLVAPNGDFKRFGGPTTISSGAIATIKEALRA